MREGHIWNQYVGFDFFFPPLSLPLPPSSHLSAVKGSPVDPWGIGSSGREFLADRDRGKPWWDTDGGRRAQTGDGTRTDRRALGEAGVWLGRALGLDNSCDKS